MTYIDYDFYCSEYFGVAVSSEEFQRLALHASQYLDYITQGQAERNADLRPLKMACCALAEQYQSMEAAQTLARKSLTAGAAESAEVQSESVGGWSRSYRSGGDSAQAAAQAEAASRSALLDTACRYLTHTGLLYRGGGRR